MKKATFNVDYLIFYKGLDFFYTKCYNYYG